MNILLNVTNGHGDLARLQMDGTVMIGRQTWSETSRDQHDTKQEFLTAQLPLYTIFQ